MIKDKLKDEDDLLDNYQGRWRNQWFLFTGENYSSVFVCDTEQEAIQRGKEWLANRKGYKGGAPINYRNAKALGRGAKGSDVSHFIPMPIGDA